MIAHLVLALVLAVAPAKPAPPITFPAYVISCNTVKSGGFVTVYNHVELDKLKMHFVFRNVYPAGGPMYIPKVNAKGLLYGFPGQCLVFVPTPAKTTIPTKVVHNVVPTRSHKQR